MKTKLILVATLAVNVVLAAMLRVPRGGGDALRPQAASPASAAAIATNTVPAPTNLTPQVIPFHWRQVESENYHRYIANLRALGCPERLIHDIILADLTALYESRKRDIRSAVFEPWVGADQEQQEERNDRSRRSALQAERDAALFELLGTEWRGSNGDGWKYWEIQDMMLGYLPEGVGPQLQAIVERYNELCNQVQGAARNILVEEDFAKLAALRTGFLNEIAARLSPADFEELRIRSQILSTETDWQNSLEAVELSGAELREVMRASLVMGDLSRELFPGDPDLAAGEMKRGQAEFEQKVGQILGPERFADYQLAKDGVYREAFRFVQQQKLPKAVARTVGRAMAGAREQLAEIRRDQTLMPDERQAALAVLAAATRNQVSAALGPAAAEYLQENGRFLPAPGGNPTISGGRQ